MPLYEYRVLDGHEGCPHCSNVFQVLQSMKDDAVACCPRCGAPVERLLFAPGIATPKTNTELKNLGFTKLVKRDTGVYENVTQTGSESKYMEAGKSDTIPHLKNKITD
ncbi:MAG: zinc ribbon domain-containing protein [Candidatus Sumerlaeia bacterium]|nr:zinc ribbon domain-containing protein [Candidatus Sumerlaeia bacterium]